MKKAALVITVSLIIIISLSACGILQQLGNGEDPFAEEDITSSDEDGIPPSDKEDLTSPGDGYPLVEICSLSQDQVGEDIRAVGMIAFMGENDEGTYAEIMEKGCKVGIFVPNEKWAQWEPDMQDAFQIDNTIEAWGSLVSFDGQLIINLSGITLYEQEETAEEEYILPEAPESALLDVPLLYSGVDGLPGMCYLGSAGMLVNYEHPELDFSDIIALGGMGSSALHVDFTEMPSLLISPYSTQSIVFMMNNLEADFVVGYHEDGLGSDTFQPAGLPFEVNAAHRLKFEDGEAALNALKQAIGSGRPVMVYLNLYYVYDDFAQTSTFWSDVLGKELDTHYMVIKGYDADYLYFNDPTDPTDAADVLAASVESFMMAWEETTEIVNAPQVGPFWMLFMDTPGEVPSAEEIIELNLEKAVDAPAEIRKFAEKPDNSDYTRFMVLELGNARINFGEFLVRNGHEEAGDLYIQSGTLLSDMAINQTTNTETLHEVADLEEAALSLLTK